MPLGYIYRSRTSGVTPPVPPVIPTTPLPTDVLGCGTYSATITTRGGGTVLTDPLRLSDLKWERILCATGQATIDAPGLQLSPRCRSALLDARPWRHELVLHRNGAPVWLGPIVKLDADSTLRVQARDVSAWLARRLVHATHTYAGVDVASVWLDVVRDALGDGVAGITASSSATGILIDREILQSSYRNAAAELDDLTRIGVDWTTILRELVGGGIVIPTEPIATLTDESFIGRLRVTIDGTEQENRSVVKGAQPRDPTTGQYTSGSNISGEALDELAIIADGLLEGTYQDDGIIDADAARAAARSRVDLLSDSAPTITGGTLAPMAPTPIDKLVPGALVTVALSESLLPVAGTYRLQSITVSMDARANEVVDVALQTVGQVSA